MFRISELNSSVIIRVEFCYGFPGAKTFRHLPEAGPRLVSKCAVNALYTSVFILMYIIIFYKVHSTLQFISCFEIDIECYYRYHFFSQCLNARQPG